MPTTPIETKRLDEREGWPGLTVSHGASPFLAGETKTLSTTRGWSGWSVRIVTSEAPLPPAFAGSIETLIQ